MGIAGDTIAATRHWRRWTLLIWLVAAAWMIAWKWNAIHWFSLSDTDDNMRIMQVRAWLHGQGWYDLRQYRLDPPGGASIHWSRLVDLPIAGMILALRPFFGGIIAEKAAVTIAPLLPLCLAFFANGMTARRLIGPAAFLLAAAILLCPPNLKLMYMPLRIDHHGWQLALLALAVAALADPRRARGGAMLGIATALSLSIGLESLHYLGVAGGFTALRWVIDREESPRLTAYGAALAAGSALGYLLFASWDNARPVCDALSPVWLSVALAGGGLLVALAATRLADWRARLALASAAATAIAAGFVLAWPHCVGRLEGVSPELYDLWLSHVREAKPLYSHGWRTALPAAALPLMGVIGSGVVLWRARESERFIPWAGIALLSLFSALLLLWQTRAAPSAQMLAVPGATALGWLLLERIGRPLLDPRRIVVAAAGFLLVSGLIVGLVVDQIPADRPAKGAGQSRKAVADANRRCPTIPALGPIARLPRGVVLTMVDLGPRLITLTHHDAIAGPYHRNGQAILDVQHAFRADNPETAHAIAQRHKVNYVLICPGLSETTIYASEAKHGFYTQLRDGKIPAWLTPVPLPKGSPFRMWRVVG